MPGAAVRNNESAEIDAIVWNLVINCFAHCNSLVGDIVVDDALIRVKMKSV